MAAYAALASLVKVLEKILDSGQDFVLHEKEQIESLHKNIIFLLEFLEDFPGEASNLEARLTVSANEAEDIIEIHFLNEICSKCSVPWNWQRLYKELENVIREIQSVVEEAKVAISSSQYNQDLMSPQSSSRFAAGGKDTVVGLEEDLIEIKGRLYGEPSGLQIIPIAGMGGVGKTTLARYAFDDPETLHHFDVRAWVSVSQSYKINKVFLGLINSIDASTKGLYDERTEVEKLLEHLYKHLKGRRYLIVFDDIWDAKICDGILRVFPDDSNSSRIIITTRDLNVASHFDSSNHPHKMVLMDEDKSWRLLKEKVFGQEICRIQLEKIGKCIARECCGLPLAIAVIAGVLSKVDQTHDAWTTVARNVSETVNTSNESFEKIISLGYTRLPHHLRSCFLYMGGFPEDYEFNVSVLIKLWVAEGFLKKDGSKDMEEVAESYLEDLAKRNLVLINKKKFNGRIKTVKMHDLLRDVCLRKAQYEKFFQVMHKFRGNFPEGIENSRRISTFSYTLVCFPNMDCLRIRTILLFHEWAINWWKSVRLLRVVDAMTIKFTSFSDEIGELLNLRYLAVSFCGLQVPESWSKLQNLETLIIRNLEYTSSLPIGIWRIPQLRHAIIWDGFLHDPCDQILALENLQTLQRLRGFTCSERILDLIPNLKKLEIVYSVSDVYETGWSKYGLTNLARINKLEKLDLYAIPIDLQSDLSQNIAFPLTLKKLTLTGSKIPWEEMSILGSLPNLQVLKLRQFACLGFEWKTNEGEFCQLKQLVIERADPHHWIMESSHFPTLEHLRLYHCHALGEIPDSIGDIPTLQLIEVDNCRPSIVESAERIKEEQCSYGNDLQIRIYRRI